VLFLLVVLMASHFVTSQLWFLLSIVKIVSSISAYYTLAWK